MSQGVWVVDASALLAAIHDETSGEYVKQHIDHCVISAVNWSEVLQKLGSLIGSVDRIEKSLQALGLSVVDFTEQDARLAASLWADGKKYGLSLADRACLATGQRLKTQIVTADRVWKELKVSSPIYVIR